MPEPDAQDADGVDRDDARVGRHDRELAALKALVYRVADADADADLFEAVEQAADRVDELEREARTDEREEVFRP